MACFSRDLGKEVPKAVPPDKSVGAWLSVQEKTTGEGNVRKSLCGGTTDDHQGVNEQENCRKHHDTLQQEDIPGKVSSRTIMTSLEHIELMAQREERFQAQLSIGHNEIMRMGNEILAMLKQATLNQRQAQWEESEREREKSAYDAEKVRNNDMQILHSVIEKTNNEFERTAVNIRELEQGQKDSQTYVSSNQEEMKQDFKRGQEGLALAAEAAAKAAAVAAEAAEAAAKARDEAAAKKFNQMMNLLLANHCKAIEISADKKVSDERSADAAEKDKDVEEEAAAIKRAEKKNAKRIKRQAASEVAAGKAETKQAADKEAAKKIAAEKAAIDNDEADKKAKAAEKVAARKKEAAEQALAERIAVVKADADAKKKAEDELDREMRAMEQKANDGKRAVKGRGRGPLKVNQADDGKKDKARPDAIKKKIEMEKIRQVDEDKVRKRATERDAIRNGRSVMFMNSLRILQERRLTARTVMNRLEVQSREEEEAQINRDLAYERARIRWVESIWNQVEEKKAKARRRCGKEERRRNEQSELFHVQRNKESDKWRSQWDLWMSQLGGVPATLIGLERAVMYNGKPCIILKKLQDTEDRYQVKLENGRILSVEHKNVRPDRAIPIRGATGRKEGMMNKEKAMQKKQRRKMNRIEKALVYWKKRALIQGKSSPSKQSRQIRTSARGLRTSDPKSRTLSVNAESIVGEGIKGAEGKNKGNERKKIELKRTNRKVVELPSAYTHCTPIDSVEDRDKQKFRSRGDKIIPSKRNLKRKSRKGSTDVFLLERTIELEID